MRSRWRRWFENSTATTFAILLHVVVGVLLLFAFKGHPTPKATPQSAPAIEAVVVDESRIQQELARLETAERERQTALRKAEEMRKREDQRLAEIKREQAKAEKTRLQEQERLARIKQETAEAEAKRKAEEKAEAKQKAEAEAKRKAEEKAEAKRKAEEKAEAKRKAEAEAKQKAEAEAKQKAEAEAKRKAEAEAKRKAEAEAKRKAEAEAKRKAEAEAKRKAEAEAKRKAEAEAKRKAEAEAEAKAKRKAEEEARNRLAESLRQQAKQRQIDSLTTQYIRLIEQRIQHNWLLPPGSRQGLICLLHIRLDDLGNVLDVSVARSSGDSNFDRSAITAVLKAEPLPIPKDPDAMAVFRSFNFKFNPGG